MGYHAAVGGSSGSDPIASGGEGMAQPNFGEGTFCTFPTGTVGGFVSGAPVYATDGTKKTLLVVDVVGPDEEGFQTVSFTNPLSVGGTAFGTTTFYGVGP